MEAMQQVEMPILEMNTTSKFGELLRWIPTRTFNRASILIALIWLAVSVPFGLMYKPTAPDFSQFYMGGIIVSRGEWGALYPIPYPSGLDNPGLAWHSKQKPLWSFVRELNGVPDDTHFILPPPSALLFVPFAKTELIPAYWIWIALSALSVWGVAVISALLYRSIVGRQTRMEGLLALIIAFSPMTARAIRIANVSPMIAAALGLTLIALISRERKAANWQGALALALGALLKYATVVLTPLLLAMRRWKMLAALSAFGLLTLAATYWYAGREPFAEWLSVILPTLSRPSAYQGNQSFPGMLARTFGRPLPSYVEFVLTVLRIVSITILLTAIARVRKEDWEDRVNVLAAASALISWLFIFSPIAWEHWPIFLCPAWGWLVWEARQRTCRHWMAPLALFLMWFPAGIFQVSGFLRSSFYLPEPFNSWQLYGVMLTLGLALTRLIENREATPAATDVHALARASRSQPQC